jgi:hypothetical protein
VLVCNRGSSLKIQEEIQYNLDIRILKLSQKTKDNARYPYNEVWHTAKLNPAGSAGVSLKTRISLSRVSLYRGYTVERTKTMDAERVMGQTRLEVCKGLDCPRTRGTCCRIRGRLAVPSSKPLSCLISRLRTNR